MRILLVDDHTLVRKGLAQLLASYMADVEIIEAGDAEEALTLLERSAVDVALVDIRMPGRGGLELLHEIRAQWPTVPVIIVTNYDNPEYVKAAMAEGASGYLLKDSTPADLSQAIAVAVSGEGNVLSARAIRNLFEGGGADEPGRRNGGQRASDAGLTKRESDILKLLASGDSNREISRQLFLSEKTVKAHLASVFRKLGVTNRTQAAMMAVSMGIGQVPGMDRLGDRRPDPNGGGVAQAAR